MEATAEEIVVDAGDPAIQSPEVAATADRRRVVTWLACAACVLVFVGLLQEPNPESWATLSRYGDIPPNDIWAGKYWRVVTSVFVHLTWLHFVFNVYWLWILGGTLERAIGSLRFLAFFITAAFVSSGIEFAVAGTTGIGVSGVVYAIFGFMWIGSNHIEAFKKVLPKQTVVLFFGWAVLCILATLLRTMNVGNAAHVSGLLFGIGVASAFTLKKRVPLMVAGLIVLILGATVPLFWAPWSAGWVAKQAYDSHARHEYPHAVLMYQRTIDRGGNRVWALENMTRAYAAMHNEQKFEETLDRLRQVDENAAHEIEKTFAGRRDN